MSSLESKDLHNHWRRRRGTKSLLVFAPPVCKRLKEKTRDEKAFLWLHLGRNRSFSLFYIGLPLITISKGSSKRPITPWRRPLLLPYTSKASNKLAKRLLLLHSESLWWGGTEQCLFWPFDGNEKLKHLVTHLSVLCIIKKPEKNDEAFGRDSVCSFAALQFALMIHEHHCLALFQHDLSPETYYCSVVVNKKAPLRRQDHYCFRKRQLKRQFGMDFSEDRVLCHGLT